MWRQKISMSWSWRRKSSPRRKAASSIWTKSRRGRGRCNWPKRPRRIRACARSSWTNRARCCACGPGSSSPSTGAGSSARTPGYHSNVGGGPQWVTTLPKDPDGSAEAIRRAIADALGVRVGVIVNDTHGRPFREGAVGVAIGLAGMEPLYSYVGEQDLYGYVLQTSVESVADELASAASLLQGQAAEGTPLALIRGVRINLGQGGALRLLRDPAKDMFR